MKRTHKRSVTVVTCLIIGLGVLGAYPIPGDGASELSLGDDAPVRAAVFAYHGGDDTSETSPSTWNTDGLLSSSDSGSSDAERSADDPNCHYHGDRLECHDTGSDDGSTVTEQANASAEENTASDEIGITDEGSGTVSEEAYIEPAPEEGDPFFEARAEDWISYLNPRDEYNPDGYGEGSGRICLTLLNEDGEPVVGESIPDTQFSMETDGIDWHSSADPFTVEFPLTEHYDRPLDADQFGTSTDLPQGDGYMDAHCIEYHDVSETHALTYDDGVVTGANADAVDIVGYYDQIGTWESDFDPLAEAEPYGTSASSDGIVEMNPDNSHAETLVVLQLNGAGGAA